MSEARPSIKDEIITIAQEFCRVGPYEVMNGNDDHVMWTSPEGYEPRLVIEAGLSRPINRGLGKVMIATLAIEDITETGIVRSSIRANKSWNGPKWEIVEDEFVGMILDEFRQFAGKPEYIAGHGLVRATELYPRTKTERKRGSQRTRTPQSA